MIPLIRRPNEQLRTINEANMIINNVNHLKEYLINIGLAHLDFTALTRAFSDYQLIPSILAYIDEKGVVPSE
jgi:hypothetical protein